MYSRTISDFTSQCYMQYLSIKISLQQMQTLNNKLLRKLNAPFMSNWKYKQVVFKGKLIASDCFLDYYTDMNTMWCNLVILVSNNGMLFVVTLAFYTHSIKEKKCVA